MPRLSPGYAAALPPAATAITTPAEGLECGEVAVPVADGTMPAYAARPAGGGVAPILLVVQEIFGVHEHIRDVCRRFAKEGFLAVAPELYMRQGDPAAAPDIATIVETIVAKVPDPQALADLDSAAAWAAGHGGDPGRLAVTGFCWGGRMTWLYAAHNPAVRAAVAWYGRLIPREPPNPAQPLSPLTAAGQLHAPVLGLYGGADKGIPPETVEQMRAALADSGDTGSEIQLYPDAPHGFFADYRAEYRPDVAADAWARCLSHLRRHLRA